MVQVKKEEVRNRIIETADRLFASNGYIASTMSQIAKQAGLASSTIYVYFPSKLDVALAIFEPWLVERMNETEIAARRISSNRKRLEYLLTRLWCDIPLEQNNYINSLMQALAISSREGNYKPTILNRMREHVRVLVTDCLPEERKAQFDAASFAHVAVMAFDGFVINGRLNPDAKRDRLLVKATCDMILGDTPAAVAPKAAPRIRGAKLKTA